MSQDPFVPSTAPLTVGAGPQKKKRTKVTDTRLSPRVARALLQDGLYHRNRSSLDLIGRKQHRSQLPAHAADLSVPIAFISVFMPYSKLS